MRLFTRCLLAALAWPLVSPAVAWDPEQGAATEPSVRSWFQRQRVPDAPQSSCCGEADAYWADSVEVEDGLTIAVITDERDIKGREPIPPGTKFVVPRNRMNNSYNPERGLDPNPTGHGVIFIDRKNAQPVLCYFAPGGV